MVLSAVVLAVAGGCADGPSRPAPRSSATTATGDLKAWLREGAEKVGQDTFTVRFSLRREGGGAEGYRGGIEMEVDPARRRNTVTLDFPVQQPGYPQWIEVKTVDGESWARFFGFGEPPEGWIPVDLAKLSGGGSSLYLGTRMASDLQDLVETVVEPQLVTERAVRGKLDLRQYPLLGTELDGMSTTELTVPFTATLDHQDRITNITVRFGQVGAKSTEWQLLYSGFGSRLPIERPTDAEIVPSNDVDPSLLSYLEDIALL